MSLFTKKTEARDVFGGGATNHHIGKKVFGGNTAPPIQHGPSAASRIVRPAATQSLFGKNKETERGNSLFGKGPGTTPQSLFSKPANAQPLQSPTTDAARSLFSKACADVRSSPRSVFGGSTAITNDQTYARGSSFVPVQPHSHGNTAKSLFTAKSSQINSQPVPGKSLPAQTLFGKSVLPGRQLPSPDTGVDDHKTLYSDMEDLTAEDIKYFAAAEFTLGCLPLKPPPSRMCQR